MRTSRSAFARSIIVDRTSNCFVASMHTIVVSFAGSTGCDSAANASSDAPKMGVPSSESSHHAQSSSESPAPKLSSA